MPRMTKPVIVTDQAGADHVFPSAVEAAEYIGCCARSVRNHIAYGYRLHGYRVRYAEAPDVPIKPADPEEMVCLFNNGVTCDNFTRCKRCGWNPYVKEKRLMV